MKPTVLDRAFQLLDDARSPQDFTLILHFNQPPNIERLHAGAKSAAEYYGAGGEIKIETRIDTEGFVNERLYPVPIKQMLNGATLATRFHHAAADGLSAALWLGHQLSVAYGLTPPENSTQLALRRQENSVRRSQFAYDSACDPLWTITPARSGTRHRITINFPSVELQQACRRTGGFTYSDLLATCALETLREWNQRHNQNGETRVGLWLPMNIRRESYAGFGNGTSRVRLYARYPASASLVQKAREVRRQLAWSTAHGEWVVPELPLLLTRAPGWIAAPLLRAYLNRPSVDMATGVFSHADRWAGGARNAFADVERIECVGLLHARQSIAINGATHRGRTWMTFTYDTGLLRAVDAQDLSGIYRRLIDHFRRCEA